MTVKHLDDNRSPRRADLLLIVLALMWGTSHVITKDILASHSPSFYTSARFGLAAICFVLLFWRHLARSSRSEIRKGILLGICSFAGIAFYVTGLIFTQVSKAGFISGLYLVFTPLLAYGLFGTRPTRDHLTGLLVALGGFVLLSFPDLRGAINWGDLLILVAAIAWATHIATTTAFAGTSDIRTLAAVQVMTVAVISIIIHLVLRLNGYETSLNTLDEKFLLQIGYMAIVVTCLAAVMQTWSQKRVSSTHAAILYTLEPVSSAVFAYLIFGEEMGTRRGLGAALIVVGVLISHLKIASSISGRWSRSDQT